MPLSDSIVYMTIWANHLLEKVLKLFEVCMHIVQNRITQHDCVTFVSFDGKSLSGFFPNSDSFNDQVLVINITSYNNLNVVHTLIFNLIFLKTYAIILVLK